MKRLIMSICLAVILETGQAAALESTDFMYWRLENRHRSNDGQQVTVYRLTARSGVISGKPEVYFKLTPWEWSGSNRKYGEPEFYSQELPAGEDAFDIEIASGRTAVIDLWAGLRFEGRLYVAQTLFNTYGNSGQVDQSPVPIDGKPSWPGLLFERDAKFYRAQTGEPLNFRVAQGNDPNGRFEIYEDEVLTATLPTSFGQDLFSYTPPHDPELSEGGFSARKDLVFVWRGSENTPVLSFYLPLYRSSYGKTDLKGGLMVLLAGILLTMGMIWRSGRRFPWR